jgi:hypothetical protein
VETGFGPHVFLHDYTGHAPDLRTDGQGRLTITLPPNKSGLGYVCYSRQGITGEPTRLPGHAVTQDCEGARDLDIPPASNTGFGDVCRIWAAAGSPIRGSLHFDTQSWAADTQLELELLSPTGESLAARSFDASAQGESLTATPEASGWHTFRIRAVNAPAANQRPSYRLSTHYTAPQAGPPE